MPATAKTEFDLDQPEGRLAAVEALGPEAYNAAMKAHVKASCAEVVNGYGIRPVATRFGKVYAVVGDDMGFSTIEAARTHALSLKPAAWSNW